MAVYKLSGIVYETVFYDSETLPDGLKRTPDTVYKSLGTIIINRPVHFLETVRGGFRLKHKRPSGSKSMLNEKPPGTVYKPPGTFYKPYGTVYKLSGAVSNTFGPVRTPY